MKKRFNNNGCWIYPNNPPIQSTQSTAAPKPHIVKTAYCPKGCNLLSADHQFQGVSAIHLKFKGENREGEFVISAVEGDHDELVLSSQRIAGEKDDLYCPHCGIALEKLINCHCNEQASMVFIGATPSPDFTKGAALCNVSGCCEGIVAANKEIRDVRLATPDFPN
ncbi:MAG: hypothetical protein J7K75_13015 [Desulfuromonas sp.]|nr:hypothetical protein [Desulfuromonas sp.]